ncbi:MAG: GGDEF domain-containing protein, partial [Brevinematia bacterium]
DFSPVIGKVYEDTPEYKMIEVTIKRGIPTLFYENDVKNSVLGKIGGIEPFSVVFVPIVINDVVVYVVELIKKKKNRKYSGFLENDIFALSIISNIASAIFTNADLFNRAIHDNLTGLYNIHYFKNLAYEEMNKVKKFRTKFSLAVIDLDHFKHVNDTYGHSVGDEALKFFSSILRQEVKRSSDIIARYGGDEFIVAFPSTDLMSAYNVCMKLRDKLNSEIFKINDKVSIVLTPSIGIADVSDEDIKNSSSNIDLFRRIFVKADTALYNSKKTGRNKVTIYTDSLPLIEEREL